jgi:Tfp pilus assembly protein PilV
MRVWSMAGFMVLECLIGLLVLSGAALSIASYQWYCIRVLHDAHIRIKVINTVADDMECCLAGEQGRCRANSPYSVHVEHMHHAITVPKPLIATATNKDFMWITVRTQANTSDASSYELFSGAMQ